MKLDKYIGMAVPIALNNERTKKHVSFIIRKGELVSYGVNKMKTHPLAKRYGYRYDEIHSELDALLRYKGPKDKLTLLNFRFNRFGEMRMSKPCKLCMPWCDVLFDRIIYSTVDGMVTAP